MTLAHLLLAVIFSARSINSKQVKRSAKYLKTKTAPYAFPIGVCYPKMMGGHRTSIRLNCTEHCVEDECERRVVAWHYEDEDCNSEPEYSDIFTEADKASYPFNCYEDDELKGKKVKEEDYDQSYMIIRISRGSMVNSTVNDTDGNEGTTTEQCVRNETSNFYKTFPAITDQCVLTWTGEGRGSDPYWYIAKCNENGIYVERYEGYNCTGDQTTGFPIYIPNGCDNRQWNDLHWYTEVLKCSNPDYTISIGFRNMDNLIVSLTFIFIITFYNNIC